MTKWHKTPSVVLILEGDIAPDVTIGGGGDDEWWSVVVVVVVAFILRWQLTYSRNPLKAAITDSFGALQIGHLTTLHGLSTKSAFGISSEDSD